MKNISFSIILKYSRLLLITIIVWTILGTSTINTVSAFTTAEQSTINGNLSLYKWYIARHPAQFKTPESIVTFYKKIKLALESRRAILNWIIDSISNEINLPASSGSVTPPQITLTDSSISSVRYKYTLWEKVFGYIKWWDIANTWLCMAPPTAPNTCENSSNFRKLGVSGDDWQLNTTTWRIELRNWFSTVGLSLWVYTLYARTWQIGTTVVPTDTNISSTTNAYFTLEGSSTVSGSIAPPEMIFTDSTISSVRYKYTLWEKVFGYVKWWDVNNTWSCMAPPTAPNTCDNSSNFRKLGGSGDDWQLNTTTWRLELRNWFSTVGYSLWVYKWYIRTWQNGTGTTNVYFTLEKSSDVTDPVNRPQVIFTNNTLSSIQSRYTLWEKVFGYIKWWDTSNTWSCMAPPTAPNTCDNSSNFRKLGGSGDDWQLNATTWRIELRNWFSTVSFPLWTYKWYVRTGQTGTDTTISNFELENSNVVNPSSQPEVVFTDSTISSVRYRYTLWEKIFGYVKWWDINNTWSCMAPPTAPNTCDNSSNFRKLGGSGDDWQLNTTTWRIELRNWFSTVSFPLWLYKWYVRTGQTGTDTNYVYFTLNP